jgi:hypothetical protein
LWLVVARAGAVMAVLMVFKVCWRITRGLLSAEEVQRRLPLVVALPVLFAALVAAASLVNSRGFVTDNTLGYSEGLMTALVLMAFDRHLDGARRQAFAIGFAAALDRPELWALWVPYGLYLWWKDPGARKLIVPLFVLVPVLWFLPEYWGSGHFFRGVTRAHHPRSNSAAFAKCPFCTEFRHHAWPRVMTRVKVVGMIALAVAAFGLWWTRRSWWRADSLRPGVRAKLVLLVAGAIGWLWWIGIAVETQAGFSGNDRYLVLGAALISIAGGVGWGWAAGAVAAWLGRRFASVRRRFALVSATAVAVAAGVLIAAPPWIGPSILDVPASHRALVYQAHLREDATAAVHKLGGSSAVLRCGTVLTEGFQVPMLAWTLGVHTLQVESVPQFGPPPPPPNIIFQTRAQRSAHLLPLLRTWPTTHYQLAARVRTFRVYEHCAGKVGA